MTTNRKFAAFANNDREGMGFSEVPAGGFCISSFLIIRDKENPRRVLMGHLEPSKDWDHIGALTKQRKEEHSKGWMLPSCHILYGESPSEAAKRIAEEQLGFSSEFLELSGPRDYSEVYGSKVNPEAKEHWDLEFVFEGKLDSKKLSDSKSEAWKDIAFVEIDRVGKNEIARSHDDILTRIR